MACHYSFSTASPKGQELIPYTYIACQTEESPFPLTTSVESVKQIRGWSVLHGLCFLGFYWFMGVGRLNRHLDYLLSE